MVGMLWSLGVRGSKARMLLAKGGLGSSFPPKRLRRRRTDVRARSFGRALARKKLIARVRLLGSGTVNLHNCSDNFRTRKCCILVRSVRDKKNEVQGRTSSDGYLDLVTGSSKGLGEYVTQARERTFHRPPQKPTPHTATIATFGRYVQKHQRYFAPLSPSLLSLCVSFVSIVCLRHLFMLANGAVSEQRALSHSFP